MAYTATLQKLSQNLLTTFENTIFENPTNIGNTREKQVIEYLRRVMAKSYDFSSGEVFDLNDNQSGQIDIIISDALHSVVFSDGSDNILAPMESTYGIISVKSKMGVKELDHAIQGIEQYNSLERTKCKENSFYINPNQSITFNGSAVNGPEQKNINCIFAFDSTVAFKTIVEKMESSGCIDLLVVPNKFCVIGRKRTEATFTRIGIEGEMECFRVNTKNSVSLFIVLLQTYLKTNQLVSRDTISLSNYLIREGNIDLLI